MQYGVTFKRIASVPFWVGGIGYVPTLFVEGTDQIIERKQIPRMIEVGTVAVLQPQAPDCTSRLRPSQQSEAMHSDGDRRAELAAKMRDAFERSGIDIYA